MISSEILVAISVIAVNENLAALDLKERGIRMETIKFELVGANEDTSNWDECDAEMLEYDIINFEKFIDKLDAKYGDYMDHINDYRYSIILNEKQQKEFIEEIEEIDCKLEHGFISYEGDTDE